MKKNKRSQAMITMWKKTIAFLLTISFVQTSTLPAFAEVFRSQSRRKTNGHWQARQDRLKSGYLSPAAVKAKMMKQQSLVDNLNHKERLGRGSHGQISAKLKNNLYQQAQEQIRSTAAQHQVFNRARNKVYAILGQNSLFNYVQYDDGKRIWFQDGLAKVVENERVVDPHGNVSLRNTYNMAYNDKRLLISYESDTVDVLGNLQHIHWYGATYTADSVFYANDETNANKLVTSYIQDSTDHFGNKTRIEWTQGQYDGKRLINYEEKLIDSRGNQSSKHWYGAKYDRNNQVIDYQETIVDVKGNRWHRRWYGGTYIDNPAHSQAQAKAGVVQSAPEYLLVAYQEVLTDEYGNQTQRIWDKADYDQYGQLTAYHETQIDALGRKKTIQWTKGTYDTFGRLIAFHQMTTNIDGVQTQLIRENSEYDLSHRLIAYQEKQIDGSGRVLYLKRLNMIYNQLGDMLAYQEERTSAKGVVATINWRNGYYDRYGRLLGYEETSNDDRKQNKTRIWKNAVYDRYDHLLAYHETNTNGLGCGYTRIWQDGEYDQYGRLLSYHEINTDELGNQSQRSWSQAEYDDVDHMIAYTEDRTDVFGNQTQVKWRAGLVDQSETNGSLASYNKNGQIIAYTEKKTDQYGQVSIREWSQGSYDQDGNLISYQERLIGADESVIVKIWEDGQYDQYDRLINYREKWEHANNECTAHHWGGVIYDNYDRLLKVEETDTDTAGRDSQLWQMNIKYNHLNQMLAYQEVIHDAAGFQTRTSWQASAYNQYGQLTDYQQSSIHSANPKVEILTEVHDRRYDRHGELSASRQTVTTQGMTADGRQVATIVTTTIDQAIMDNNTLQAFRQVTRTTGRDPDGTMLDLKETKQVTARTPFSRIETYHYQAPGAADGSSEALDHSIIINRSQIVRNYAGQITGYQEEVFDEATPAGRIIRERRQSSYNSRGQLMSYVEKEQGLTGRVSWRYVSGLLYNGLNQLTSSQTSMERTSHGEYTLPPEWANLESMEQQGHVKEIINTIGFGLSWDGLTAHEQGAVLLGETIIWQDQVMLHLDHANNSVEVNLFLSEKVQRTDMCYGVLGRQVYYQEERQVKGQNEHKKTVWQATEFTPANQVRREVIQETIYYPTLGQWFGQEYQKQIERSKMAYNRYGQLLSYQENSRDSRTPDLTTQKIVKDMSYDALGRMAEQDELTHFTGATTQALPDQQLLEADYLTGMQLLTLPRHETGQAQAWAWDQLSPEQQEQLLDGQEVTLSTSSGSFELSLQDKQATVIQVMMDLTIHTIRHQAKFDTQGRIIGYTETTHTQGQDKQGNRLDKTESKVRNQIEYDQNQQIIAYHEMRTSSVASDLVLNVWMNNLQYDPQGQLSGYTEKLIKRSQGNSPDYYLEIVTHRSKSLYNGAGQLLGYHEQVVQSDQPQVTQNIIRRDMIYNQSSQLQAYQEIQVTSDPELGKHQTHVNVDHIITNSLGQEIGRQETTRTKAWDRNQQLVLEQEQTLTTSDVLYNGLNQKIASIEKRTGAGLAGMTTTLFGKAQYNEHGQLLGFEQLNLTQSQDLSVTLNQHRQVTRRHTQYNTLGQIIETIEEHRDSSAPDKRTIEQVSAMTYTTTGQQFSYNKQITETSTSELPLLITTTINRLSTSYHHGRSIAYEEDINKTGQWINPETNEKESLNEFYSIIRDAITYSAGRQVLSYHQITSGNNSAGSEKTVHWQAEYDLLGRTIATQESRDDGLIATTEKRTIGAFDELGRVISETQHSSKRSHAANDLNQPLQNIETTINRLDQQYDDQNRLVSYLEHYQASDQPSVIRTTHRLNTHYDRLGREQTYQEQQVNLGDPGLLGQEPTLSNTKLITRKKTNYNGLSRILNYQDEIIHGDRDIKETINRAQISYDEIGRVKTYYQKKQEKDSQGHDLNQVTEIWRELTAYEATRGNLTHYREKQINSSSPDLATTISWSAHDFDQANRVIKYEQKRETVNTAGKAHHIIANLVREKISYDQQNRELSYAQLETSTDAPDLTITTNRRITNYNELGQVIAFDEERLRHDLGGPDQPMITAIERSSIEYNSIGQEVAYHEQMLSSQSPNLRTITDWEHGQYNRLGQLISFDQVQHQTGQDEHGQDLNVVIHTKRLATDYNDQGQLASQAESSNSSAASQVTTTEVISEMVYNDHGQRETFMQTITKASADQLLFQTTSTKRDQTSYDALGRMLAYQETTSRSNSENLVTNTSWQALDYDGLARVVGFKETSTSIGLNQSDQEVLHHTVNTIRRAITYNAQNQQLAYHEEINSPSEGQISRDWQALHYNQLGQLAHYREKGRKADRGDYTYLWNATFDQYGRVDELQEQLKTDNGSLDYNKHKTQTKYNDKGQIIAYQETGQAINQPNYTKLWKADFADAYTQAGEQQHYQERFISSLGVSTEKEWSQGTYNQLGQLIGYSESEQTELAGMHDQRSTRIWRADFADAYNQVGQLNHYEEIKAINYHDPQSGRLIDSLPTKKIWQAGKYDQGLLQAFTEQTLHYHGLDQEYGTTVNRQDMTYDRVGHLLSYLELGDGPATGHYEKEWLALGFNEKGQETGYVINGYAQAGGVNHELVRKNQRYDDYGRLLTFNEQGISSGSYVDRQWAATTEQYDHLGRLLAYRESGWNENGRYEKSQYDMVYNYLSQLKSYTENTWDNANGEVVNNVSEINYDHVGRRLSYHQIAEQRDLETIRVSDWLALAADPLQPNAYNDSGQLLGYHESTQSLDLDGQVIEEREIDWQAGFEDSYTDLGQLRHYLTTTERFSPDLGKRTITREQSHGQFYEDGRLKAYHEQTINRIEHEGMSQESTAHVIRSDIEYYATSHQSLDEGQTWGSQDDRKTAAQQSGWWQHQGMMASYQELQLGSQAEGKPSQRILEAIHYDFDGRQLGYVAVTADEDLLAGFLRRFSSWLNLSRNELPATFELANLLAIKPGELITNAIEWMSNNVAGFTDTIKKQVTVLLNDLSSLLSVTFDERLDVVGTYRHTPLQQPFVAFIENLSLEVVEQFSGQPTADLPAWPAADTAYAKLHPFDYTATVTRRINTVYDEMNRPIAWQEKTRSTAQRDKMTKADVYVTYHSHTRNYTTYRARLFEHEVGVETGKITNLYKYDYHYNSLHQATAYKEAVFATDLLHVDEQLINWQELNNVERTALINSLINNQAEVEQQVIIKDYANVTYNAIEQMLGYDCMTYERGYTFQQFAESFYMVQALKRQNEIMSKQQEIINEQQMMLTEAERAWQTAWQQAIEYFGLNADEYPPHQVEKLITYAKNEVDQANLLSAAKENEVDMAKSLLDAAYHNKGQVLTGLITAKEKLAAAENDWRVRYNEVNQLVKSLIPKT